MTDYLPVWAHAYIERFMPLARFAFIILIAWLVRRIAIAVINRLNARSIVPSELVIGLRRIATFLVTATAVLLILEGMGVSAAVLWTAFTGFAAVAAVAFFAAWSVLSNIFCTFLLVLTRPFRLYDQIELLESGDKPGLRGQVVDVNVIYTTLKETPADDGTASVLQIPNSLFFQRVVRRWDRR
jgi:small-conductance mechanosensitive channel